jgi:hypothetical protein
MRFYVHIGFNIIHEKEWVPGEMARICNPSTWEAEARRSQGQSQSGLHRETLSQAHQCKIRVDKV